MVRLLQSVICYKRPSFGLHNSSLQSTTMQRLSCCQTLLHSGWHCHLDRVHSYFDWKIEKTGGSNLFSPAESSDVSIHLLAVKRKQLNRWVVVLQSNQHSLGCCDISCVGCCSLGFVYDARVILQRPHESECRVDTAATDRSAA